MSSSSASTVANFAPVQSYRHVFNLFLSLPILVILRTVAQSTPYAKQGFFCNDNEIRFPYVPDTVPASLVDWVTTLVGIFVIISSECSLVRHLVRRHTDKRLHRGDAPLHPVIINCLFFIAALFCSKLSTTSICDLGKRACSRLRPNFIDVCQPKNLSGLCPPNEYGYVQNYECTNKLFDKNEFFSFPSGHAAHVCSFTVFITYYMQKRCKFPAVLRSFAQFFIALFAYFVCLSRVRDHKHRLTDVVGGALTGIALGSFFIRFMLHNFRPNRYSMVDKEWPEDIEATQIMPLIGDKFSLPSQTTTLLFRHCSKSVDEGRRGNAALSRGNEELSPTPPNFVSSDYGSTLNGKTIIYNFLP